MPQFFLKHPPLPLVEAFQFDGSNQPQIEAWMGKTGFLYPARTPPGKLCVPSLKFSALPGDWIVRSRGFFSVVTPEDFAQSYSPVIAPSAATEPTALHWDCIVINENGSDRRVWNLHSTSPSQDSIVGCIDHDRGFLFSPFSGAPYIWSFIIVHHSYVSDPIYILKSLVEAAVRKSLVVSHTPKDNATP